MATQDRRGNYPSAVFVILALGWARLVRFARYGLVIRTANLHTVGMATKTIDLDRLRADLEAARLTLSQLHIELRDANQRVNDLSAYIELTERLYPELMAASVPKAEPVPAIPAEAAGADAVVDLGLDGLDTKTAALAVLKATAPQAWKVEALAAEMVRRGWHLDAKQRPELLVASAMSRLYRGGEALIIKPRYGYYAWKPPEGLAANGVAKASGSATLGSIPPFTLGASGNARVSGSADWHSDVMERLGDATGGRD